MFSYCLPCQVLKYQKIAEMIVPRVNTIKTPSPMERINTDKHEQQDCIKKLKSASHKMNTKRIIHMNGPDRLILLTKNL